MSLLRFIYSKILKREYPLIRIPKKASFNTPFASRFPEEICLKFSKGEMERFGITEDNIHKAIIDILAHEYTHIILWRIKKKAGNQLDKINSWNPKHHQVTWKLWKSKDERDKYVWETIEGIEG